MPKTSRRTSSRRLKRKEYSRGAEFSASVAVVGAGCAGLYSAWRVATTTKADVCVFEKDDRIGGRLWSVDLLSPLIPDLPLLLRPRSTEHTDKPLRHAELGGMRFTDKQVLINHLINELTSRLRKELLAENDADDEDMFGFPKAYNPLKRDEYAFDTQLMYLRDVRLNQKDEKWRDLLPYAAAVGTDETELRKVAPRVAKDVLRKALKLMLPATKSDSAGWQRSIEALVKEPGDNLKKRTLRAEAWREWQEHAKLGKRHIFDLGFWGLIKICEDQNVVRKGTEEFLRDALGYHSLFAESNAAQAIPVFLADFDDPVYQTLVGGMDVLPKVLNTQCKTAGCLVAENHAVEAIEFVDGRGARRHFKLTLRYTPKTSDGKKDERLTGLRTCHADKVILALPKSALKEIRFVGFQPQELKMFKDNLEHVTPHPAVKLFLRYDTPWWKEDLSKLEARAITDEAIRQVYYYGSDTGQQSFIMGYCDDYNTGLWMKDESRWRIASSKLQELHIGNSHVASPTIIEKAEQQLRLIHGREEALGARCGIVKRWSDAWHFWDSGIKPWDVATRLIRPFGGIDLFTCGEAYSLEQGWVEGALKSAERVTLEMGIKPLMDDHQFRTSYGSDGYAGLKDYIEH